MKVGLLDYRRTRSEHEIGDLKDIVVAVVHVISGDETMWVLYKDGTEATFDSNKSRMLHFDDGRYVAYCPECWIDWLNNAGWQARESSRSPLCSKGGRP